MINSQSVSYLVDVTVTSVAYETIYRQPTMLPVLATVTPSATSQEVNGSIGGLDLFEETEDGVDPTEDTIANLFAKTFVHRERKKSFTIARTVIDDNRFNLLAKIGEQMGEAYYLTVEQDLVKIFQDSFAGALHKSEDAVAICGSHTYGSTTQSNGSITTALSYEAFKSVQTASAAWLNSRGLPERSKLDTLLVPSAKQEDGWQILGQQIGRPDETNRMGNYYASVGTTKMIVWDLLDVATNQTSGSQTRWWVLDLMKFKSNLKWFMRAPLETYGEQKMFGSRKLGAYARYSYGVVNPFGVYGVNATA